MNIVFLGIDLAINVFQLCGLKPGRQTGLYETNWPKRIAPDAGKYSCMSDWDRSVHRGILLAA